MTQHDDLMKDLWQSAKKLSRKYRPTFATLLPQLKRKNVVRCNSIF